MLSIQKNKMKFWGLGILLFVIMTASACSSSQSGETESPENSGPKKDIVIGGGSLGGIYYTLAGAIGDLLQTELDTVERASALTGSSNQFIAQMQSGNVDLSMATPDNVYFGWSDEEGQGWKEGESNDKVNIMAAGYINIMALVAKKDSNIETIEDIGEGAVGVLSSTLQEPMEEYLKAHGIENPNVVIIGDWNQMGQALRDGSIDVMQAIAAHPMPAVMELSTSLDLKLVESKNETAVDTFLEGITTKFFQRIVLPAGTYDWLTEDYHTVGRGTILTATTDLSEDQVYEMTKLIYESADKLSQVHPLAADFNLEMFQEYLDAGTIQVPIHPGARRYFEEKGLTIPDSVPKN